MIEVGFSSFFKKAFRKRISKNKELEARFWERLEKFTENPFHSTLRTHKMSGELEDLWSIPGLKYRKKIDLILTANLPFGLIGAIISAFIRKPLIWDTNDGDLLMHGQLLNCSSLYTRTSLLLEKFIGRMARVIIVPSELDRKLYYEQNYPLKDKIKVIPSGIDLSPVEKIIQEFKEDKISLRQKIGLAPEKKILIFGGNRDYSPNKEAAFWLNNEFTPAQSRNLWPRLLPRPA